jgi:hypothetical protein
VTVLSHLGEGQAERISTCPGERGGWFIEPGSSDADVVQ